VKRSRSKELRALGALDLAADGKAPAEFRIFAYGKNSSDKGEFVFDEKAAKLVMAAFAKKGSRLTMDYEHQALNAPDNGMPAPNSAKAWTPEVRMDANGKPELWATNVSWTDKARAFIESGEYVHFSPAFETEPNSMRVARILNMALTNIPALDNQEPLVAASNADGDRPMKKMTCKMCSKALRAPTDDDDGDEVACASHAHSALTALSGVVGLKAGATMEAVSAEVVTLSSLRANLLTTLGVDSIEKAMGEIVALKAKAGEVEKLHAKIAADADAALTKELDGILAEAGESGKIAPAELEKTVKPILSLSGGKPTKENLAVIRDVVAKLAPKVATAGNGGEKKPTSVVGHQLTADDIAVCRLTGIAPDDLTKFNADTAAGKFKGMGRPMSAVLQPTAQEYYR
jgi:phage I-like protein